MPKFEFLPVKITDTEKLVILAEQSALIAEIEKLKAEKARLPEAIKTLEGALYVKNHALISGVIEREIEIREEPNAFSATVKRFRMDTGEEIASRAMDPEEAQMQLGNSSVPGSKDNVRSLAEARAKTEEQLAAGTPEEAEALRNARLADEQRERVAAAIASIEIETIDRGDGTFVAKCGVVPGLSPESGGYCGPIRPTADEARAKLVSELERLIAGTAAPAPSEADVREAEIAALEAEDDASTKPKRGLKVPKGAKGRRTKPAKAEDANGVDTTPPEDCAF